MTISGKLRCLLPFLLGGMGAGIAHALSIMLMRSRQQDRLGHVDALPHTAAGGHPGEETQMALRRLLEMADPPEMPPRRTRQVQEGDAQEMARLRELLPKAGLVWELSQRRKEHLT